MKANKIPNIMMWMVFLYYFLVKIFINAEENLLMKTLAENSFLFLMPLLMMCIFWKHHNQFQEVNINQKDYWIYMGVNLVLPVFICFAPYRTYYHYFSVKECIKLYLSCLAVKYTIVAIGIMMIYPLMKKAGKAKAWMLGAYFAWVFLVSIFPFVPNFINLFLEYSAYLWLTLFIIENRKKIARYVRKREVVLYGYVGLVTLIGYSLYEQNVILCRLFRLFYILTMIMFTIFLTMTRKNTIWKNKRLFRGYTMNKIYRFPTIVKITVLLLFDILKEIGIYIDVIIHQWIPSSIIDLIGIIICMVFFGKCLIDTDDYWRDISIFEQEE